MADDAEIEVAEGLKIKEFSKLFPDVDTELLEVTKRLTLFEIFAIFNSFQGILLSTEDGLTEEVIYEMVEFAESEVQTFEILNISDTKKGFIERHFPR